jgi:hypothetical protein
MNLFIGQDILMGHQLNALGRHAIDTAQIATVCY